MRVVWEKGPRRTIVGKDMKGKEITRLGKNGGPVIEQKTVKVLTP